MDLSIIKKKCEKRPRGLTGLASEIGMSTNNLHRCIKENRMEAGMLEQVMNVLGIRADEIFDIGNPSVQFHNHGSGMQVQNNGKMEFRRFTVKRKGQPTYDELVTENNLLRRLLDEKDLRLAEKDDFIRHLKGEGDEGDQ